LWKKYGNKIAKQYFYVFLLAVSISFWAYFTDYFLLLSGQALMINYYFIKTLRFAVIILVIWVLYKDFLIKNK
jgi:hypothetical protein